MQIGVCLCAEPITLVKDIHVEAILIGGSATKLNRAIKISELYARQ